MNHSKTIAQYELYSGKGEIPSRLSSWLEGTCHQLLLSNGAYVRLANIKVSQQVGITENSGPGVTFSFMAKQSLGVEASSSESICPGCNRKKNQIAQVILLPKRLKEVAQFAANQHITSMQLYVPFSRLEKMVGVNGQGLNLSWFSAPGDELDDGMYQAQQREVLPIHVNRQIAQTINAIYKRGFGQLQNGVDLVPDLCDELLQRLVGHLQQRNFGYTGRKDAVSPHLYTGLSGFGDQRPLVIH